MSTKATRKQVAQAIDKLLGGKLPAPKVAEMVAAYLASERRTKELDGVMRSLLELRASGGIYEAQATSAFELDAKTQKDLEDLVRAHHKNARQIIMHQRRDPSLVGGVKLETSDLRLDTSIHDRLAQLSQLTTNAT